MKRSSLTDEVVDIDGKKMWSGEKDSDWFLARKEGFGSRWTPSGVNLIKPGLTDKAWISLLLREEAAATRKMVFLVRASRGEFWIGS